MHKIVLLTLSTLFFVSMETMDLPESVWKEKLSTEQYQSLREKKQDRAFLNLYATDNTKGVFHCAGCDLNLFLSEDKIQSITSYPSFRKPCDKKNIYYLEDYTTGYKRYEVVCRKCKGHLGHVFKEAGAQDLIYCINSSSIIRKN